ncbi:hypothetical protein LZ31DRAFT_128479 [Colletotrichum somersetense]|nr:hypothetical protein LZ31DRAFT_128479 [Colletotrichum somersetense]
MGRQGKKERKMGKEARALRDAVGFEDRVVSPPCLSRVIFLASCSSCSLCTCFIGEPGPERERERKRYFGVGWCRSGLVLHRSLSSPASRTPRYPHLSRTCGFFGGFLYRTRRPNEATSPPLLGTGRGRGGRDGDDVRVFVCVCRWLTMSENTMYITISCVARGNVTLPPQPFYPVKTVSKGRTRDLATVKMATGPSSGCTGTPTAPAPAPAPCAFSPWALGLVPCVYLTRASFDYVVSFPFFFVCLLAAGLFNINQQAPFCRIAHVLPFPVGVRGLRVQMSGT